MKRSSKAPSPVPAIPSDLRARLVGWYGEPAVSFAERSGVRVIALGPRDTFAQHSGALSRLGVAVDRWPIPPAGLFVVEERTAYLRSISDMTLAHEFAHALDLALGGGDVYLSTTSAEWRRAFTACDAFVTPYAASGLDEFFAETLRAYVKANDPSSLWPRATRARLQALSPALCDLVARTLGGIE